MFVIVQSLGRTPAFRTVAGDQFGKSPGVAGPAGVYFWAEAFSSHFWIKMTLPLNQLRYAVIGGFVTLCCLPLHLRCYHRKPYPWLYPPYYPPEISRLPAG